MDFSVSKSGPVTAGPLSQAGEIQHFNRLHFRPNSFSISPCASLTKVEARSVGKPPIPPDCMAGKWMGGELVEGLLAVAYSHTTDQYSRYPISRLGRAMLILIFSLVLSVALLAAFCASITAACTGHGPKNLKFIARFKAAYLSWFAAFAVLFGVYFLASSNAQPPGSVSPFLIIAILVGGGWGALLSVRNARLR